MPEIRAVPKALLHDHLDGGRRSAGEALDAAVWMVDLTTLEGADTPGQVAGLRAKARTWT